MKGKPQSGTDWRDQLFVEHFLMTGDLGLAAKGAYSKAKDLNRAGLALFKRPEVQAKLKRRLDELSISVGLPAEDVLMLVRSIPFFVEAKKKLGQELDGRVLH